MARRSKAKKYVLFGCSSVGDEEAEGYVGEGWDGRVCLVEDRDSAFVYEAGKDPGHGTPEDWASLFKEDYGLDVHPVYLSK